MNLKTRSYDVFDTVVTRAFAHPRDLFVHLGECLGQRGLIHMTPLEFARLRWTNELAARQKSPGREVGLAEIYHELALLLHWDEVTTNAAQAVELEVESRHLHAIPYLREELVRAREEAGRLLFLSDMYLPSVVLRAWLTREGVMQPTDVLLVSGEARANKNSGKLFAIARQQTGGDYARWHHTGDHPVSDVAKPRELGLTATHRTEAWLTPREHQVRGTEGEFAEVWRSLLAGAMRLARLQRLPADERQAVLWETGATVAGPLFTGFVRWILAEAKRRGLRRLYFLARDGQIFWRIAQAIQANNPSGVECIYLHASRLLFAGAAEANSPEALRTLVAPGAVYHSLRQALLVLGLDTVWAEAHLPKKFQSHDPNANLPQPEREALADWLLAPSQRSLIAQTEAQRWDLARAYLHAAGLNSSDPVALVDAGWFGTIQRNLECILGGTSGPVPLTGFYLGLMPAGARPFAGEAIGYTNLFAPLPLLREESHKVLIELMAQADHGQAEGFEECEGRVTVRWQDIGPTQIDEVRLFQEAVLAFTHRSLAVQDVAETSEEAYAKTVIGIYRQLHDHPTAREVRTLGFMPHSDQYYELRYACLCADLNLSEIFTAIRDYHHRPPHWWIAGQATLGHAPLLHFFRIVKKYWWRLTRRPE